MNMRNYTTQMDAARKGILTPEIKTVAQKEHMSTDEMMKLVAEGKVAICANKNHTCLNPEGVGSMLRTKINVNLGVSRDCKDYDIEMQKVMSAVNLGAEAIMDLSSHGNTQPFRQKLTHAAEEAAKALAAEVQAESAAAAAETAPAAAVPEAPAAETKMN